MTSYVTSDNAEVTEQDLTTHAARGRPRWVRWTCLALAVLLALGTGAFLMLRQGHKNPQGTRSATTTGSVATVARRDLEATAQLNGTLGYGATAPVTVPTGTDPVALQQARDALVTARQVLAGDVTTEADTASVGRKTMDAAVVAAEASKRGLAAAKTSEHTSCRTPTTPDCASARQQVSTARGQLDQADAAISSSIAQATAANNQAAAKVAADRAGLASARAAWATARSRSINPGKTFTAVAAVGATVTRGKSLYAVDGVAVPLLYGKLIPWRALYRGVSGTDVAALNANLAALGYGAGLAQLSTFSAATERAVKEWQKRLHSKATGIVALGDVSYRPGPVVVTAVTATVGQSVGAGSTVLATSSTTRVVTVSLDAARQSQVKKGDRVTVTLPSGQTVAALVTSVGRVATAADDSSGQAGASKGSTIPVVISLKDPKVAVGLDKAPVLAGVTTGTARNALVVPVTALLALAGGGYAVEVVDGATHTLIGVTLGLFDDNQGFVEVTDTTLKVGQHVAVPSS